MCSSDLSQSLHCVANLPHCVGITCIERRVQRCPSFGERGGEEFDQSAGRSGAQQPTVFVDERTVEVERRETGGGGVVAHTVTLDGDHDPPPTG